MGNSKVMVYEKRKSEVIHFADEYIMRVESQKQCEIIMNGQVMEVKSEFIYRGCILCKYGSLEEETREREPYKEGK